jgi:3-phenylpropionate/trans-cinnamate dioxygenase ferredoxin reductase subunit
MKAAYAIIGGGLAAISAVKGIRSIDKSGSIILLGAEPYLPYHRPPLTKGLWTGKKTIEQIFVENSSFFEENNVSVFLSTKVTGVDLSERKIVSENGNEFTFEKLLFATGGTPRKLSIPGGDLEGICYFRYLDDYKAISPLAKKGARAVVIGGGFIGSELSASLSENNVEVIQIFREKYMCRRVFPGDLGAAIAAKYRELGVRLYPEQSPVEITKKNEKFFVRTDKGNLFEAEMVIAGLGIIPEFEIAKNCGLRTANGIIVNEFLETSDSKIFACGDVAIFPYKVLSRTMRIEHWDNALNQGEHAGKNMAGLHQPYVYMPYFFSDLFDFGYEAVGDVNSELETVSVWGEPYSKGIIYYLRDGLITGVMLCGVWGKVDAARRLIENKMSVKKDELKKLISIE